MRAARSRRLVNPIPGAHQEVDRGPETVALEEPASPQGQLHDQSGSLEQMGGKPELCTANDPFTTRAQRLQHEKDTDDSPGLTRSEADEKFQERLREKAEAGECSNSDADIELNTSTPEFLPPIEPPMPEVQDSTSDGLKRKMADNGNHDRESTDGSIDVCMTTSEAYISQVSVHTTHEIDQVSPVIEVGNVEFSEAEDKQPIPVRMVGFGGRFSRRCCLGFVAVLAGATAISVGLGISLGGGSSSDTSSVEEGKAPQNEALNSAEAVWNITMALSYLCGDGADNKLSPEQKSDLEQALILYGGEVNKEVNFTAANVRAFQQSDCCAWENTSVACVDASPLLRESTVVYDLTGECRGCPEIALPPEESLNIRRRRDLEPTADENRKGFVRIIQEQFNDMLDTVAIAEVEKQTLLPCFVGSVECDIIGSCCGIDGCTCIQGSNSLCETNNCILPGIDCTDLLLSTCAVPTTTTTTTTEPTTTTATSTTSTTPTATNDKAIRLADGGTIFDGRVELKYNGVWGTICRNSLVPNFAKTACRKLGYEDGTVDDVCPDGSGPTYQDLYVIIFDALNCTGNEEVPGYCPNGKWEDNHCDHTQDICVTCKDPNST